MNKMHESLLPVEVLEPTVVATTANQDSDRMGFNGFRKIMFYTTAEAADRNAWIDDETLTLTLNEATALSGGVTDDMRAIEIVGGINVLEAEIWTEGHADGDEVTVNGITFPRTTAGFDAAARPLEWNTPAQLITNINRECEGITAAAAAATHGVPLSVDDPGTMTLTVGVDITAASGQLATLKACGILEAYVGELTHADDMEYVFVNVDNNHATATLTGNVTAYTVAIKGSPYHAPVNQVAAATA